MKTSVMVIFLGILLGVSGCSKSDSSASPVVNEEYFSQQWAIHYDAAYYEQKGIDTDAGIHADETMRVYTGESVKVAVIDDGLDMNHIDLRDALYASYDIETGSDNVSHTHSYDYHGTAVTGVIGARKNSTGITGVAPNAEIIFLKYTPYMSDAQTIELFNKAVALGADVINCSWGSGAVSPAVEATIQEIAREAKGGRGIPIVFACGNDGINMAGDESNIPEVISVGASDKSNDRAYYSNYGSNLDILAPGGLTLGIATLDPMGDAGVAHIDENYILADDSYAFIGTSAAAPIVTGMIALMLEKNRNLSAEEIETLLKQSADKIGNTPYDENGHNIYYGNGKANLGRVMTLF